MALISTTHKPDFLIIGAGIIGLSVALELKKQFSDSKITIIDKEKNLGVHASGRNSGVLHAGFYYSDNSLKAKLCRNGNNYWHSYCLEKKLKINQCGKLVIARNEGEIDKLDELYRRGQKNGVELELITEKQAKEIEPNINTFNKALFSPTTATIDPHEILASISEDVLNANIEIIYNKKFLKKIKNIIITNSGRFEPGYLINTSGLYADVIAREYNFSREYRILPFKGLYLHAKNDALKLRTNVYPVPDLENPFLGVHFTVTVDNATMIGPTAIPAFWRENYSYLNNFNLNEFLEIISLESSLFINNNFGFRGLALREIKKYSKRKLIKIAGSLLKNINLNNFTSWGNTGIRAQLINTKTKKLEMDFKFEGDKKSFHILNAVSPAFTCAEPFSKLIVENIKSKLN